MADGMQYAIKQKTKTIYTKTSSGSLSRSETQQDQNDDFDHALPATQQHRNINTDTAYVEDTAVMVCSHTQPDMVTGL